MLRTPSDCSNNGNNNMHCILFCINLRINLIYCYHLETGKNALKFFIDII